MQTTQHGWTPAEIKKEIIREMIVETREQLPDWPDFMNSEHLARLPARLTLLYKKQPELILMAER